MSKPIDKILAFPTCMIIVGGEIPKNANGNREDGNIPSWDGHRKTFFISQQKKEASGYFCNTEDALEMDKLGNESVIYRQC